jgi:hypothetical protein
MHLHKGFLYSWATIIFISLFTGILPVPITFAHETKTQGTISALLHIVPNDDPYIKEPSYMLVEFTDKAKVFSAEQCDCKVSITRQGTELYSAPISDPEFTKTPHSISFAYTFPEMDIYTLTIEGKSPVNAFDPFIFSFDIRVDEERSGYDYRSIHALFGHHWHHLIPAIVVVFAVIVILIHDSYKQNRYTKSIK